MTHQRSLAWARLGACPAGCDAAWRATEPPSPPLSRLPLLTPPSSRPHAHLAGLERHAALRAVGEGTQPRGEARVRPGSAVGERRLAALVNICAGACDRGGGWGEGGGGGGPGGPGGGKAGRSPPSAKCSTRAHAPPNLEPPLILNPDRGGAQGHAQGRDRQSEPHRALADQCVMTRVHPVPRRRAAGAWPEAGGAGRT